MLDKIKILLGLTSDEKDDLLQVLIDQAVEEAMAITHRDDATGLDTAIIQMVVYNYNRLGTEGLDAESYANVKFDYSASYPDSIISFLKSKRMLVAL